MPMPMPMPMPIANSMDTNTGTQSQQLGTLPSPPQPPPPQSTITNNNASASKRKRAGPSTNHTNSTNTRTNLSSEPTFPNLSVLPSTIKPKRAKKSTQLVHQQQGATSTLLNDPQTPTDAVQDAEAAAVAALTSGRFQMPSPPASQSRVFPHKPSVSASKNHAATSSINANTSNAANNNSNEYDLDVDNDEKEIARVEAELAKLENYAPESKRDLSGTTSALSRKMTPEEHALMLLKRKLRNRLSAARSRRRHQLTLAKLQEEIDNLNQYSNRIMEQCENTSAENGVLREENMRLYCENMSLRAHLAAINGSGGASASLTAPPQPPISMSLPQYPVTPSGMPLIANVPLNPNAQDPSGNVSGNQPSAPASA